MKSSAGAAEHLPVARVSNLASTLSELKRKTLDLRPTWAAAIGARRLFRRGGAGGGFGRDWGVAPAARGSDVVVSLPMLGKIGSLNASVAAGVILYEMARQRRGLRAK
jgi:23S rRNA (guanosine2251-2'-O)-methyltransferase